MALSVYDISVPVYRQLLMSLDGVLDKAAAHCAANSIDPATYMNTRLYADMAPFTFQVMQAINHSVGGLYQIMGKEFARPTGLETFAGQKKAIADALAALDAIKPADLEGAENRTVELKFPGREMKFTGLGYLQSFAMPQFFFHATTAYDILRHLGVPVGKRDFLGKTQMLAA
jgi:uncharacterized protein